MPKGRGCLELMDRPNPTPVTTLQRQKPKAASLLAGYSLSGTQVNQLMENLQTQLKA